MNTWRGNQSSPGFKLWRCDVDVQHTLTLVLVIIKVILGSVDELIHDFDLVLKGSRSRNCLDGAI
jgi:hypothetical protein